MKRRTFLKALGLVPVAIAAPKLVLSVPLEPVVSNPADKEAFLKLLDYEMEAAVKEAWDISYPTIKSNGNKTQQAQP